MRRSVVSDPLCLKRLVLTHPRHFCCHFSWILRGGGGKHSETLQILLLQADIFQGHRRNNEEAERKQRRALAAAVNRRPFQPQFCHALNLVSLSCFAAPPDRAAPEDRREQKWSCEVGEREARFKDAGDLATLSRPDERTVSMQGDGRLLSVPGESLPFSRQEPTVRRPLLIHATCDVIKAGGQAPRRCSYHPSHAAFQHSDKTEQSKHTSVSAEEL